MFAQRLPRQYSYPDRTFGSHESDLGEEAAHLGNHKLPFHVLDFSMYRINPLLIQAYHHPY